MDLGVPFGGMNALAAVLDHAAIRLEPRLRTRCMSIPNGAPAYRNVRSRGTHSKTGLRMREKKRPRKLRCGGLPAAFSRGGSAMVRDAIYLGPC